MASLMSRASASLIDSIQKFSSCEIADALVQLKCPHGGYLPDLNIYSPEQKTGIPRQLCGEAFTVQMVLASDTQAPRPHAAEEGTIIVISCPQNTKNAVWGGLMTARAQSLGVKGVVIDGRCRDLVEHRDAGFHVLARSHSILGQSTFTRPSRIQEPITIQVFGENWLQQGDLSGQLGTCVTVNPYDIILADEDGVVVIPKAMVEKVMEICSRNFEIDQKCMKDLKAGRSIKETFGEHRAS